MEKNSLLKPAESRQARSWSTIEHSQFLDGLRKFGNNWNKIEQQVGTKTSTQVMYWFVSEF